MNKREEQRKKRKQEILNCSLDFIISRGYEAMKIRDIADKMNMSVGLFFNYFESKEKVYEELVKIGLSGPVSLLNFNDEEGSIEVFEEITEKIFTALKSCSMTAKMFLLMIQTMKSETAPESVKKIIDNFDVITPIIPYILKGQKLKKIKQGDPIALAAAFWGAIQGVSEMYALYPERPLPKSQWIVDIIRDNNK